MRASSVSNGEQIADRLRPGLRLHDVLQPGHLRAQCVTELVRQRAGSRSCAGGARLVPSACGMAPVDRVRSGRLGNAPTYERIRSPV